MLPIRDLLNRIRWDREFGGSFFEIGYLDHIRRSIVRVPFRSIRFVSGNHFSCEIEDVDGEVLTIPFHRIRQVYRDDILIWRRPSPELDEPLSGV
jgi:uncharacterized protein (UPF0248 family)